MQKEVKGKYREANREQTQSVLIKVYRGSYFRILLRASQGRATQACLGSQPLTSL